MSTQVPVSLGSLQTPYFKCLLYGGPGVGKTIFTCSSQTMMTFLFDVDDGAISARSYAQKNNLNPDFVHVWRVSTYDDFINAYTYLVANLKNYQLIVLDTATELQQVILSELREKANIKVATQREWGIAFLMMEKAMRMFRHLACHVIWTAHEAEKQDEFYHRIMYSPSFQGAFGGPHYAKHFSEIWRYRLIEQQQKLENGQNDLKTVVMRYLQCHPDQFTVIKDRSMSLDEYELPNIDNVFNKMVVGAISQNINTTLEEE